MIKNILFDLYTPQLCKGGAAEYIRKVFFALASEIESHSYNVNLFALVDNSIGFNYQDLSPVCLNEMGVTIVDIHGKTLGAVIDENKIDKVFIGAAQYWGMHLDVSNIKCPVVCVIHDLMDEEFAISNMREYMLLDNPYKYIHFKCGEIWRKLNRRCVGVKRMAPIMDLYNRNPKCHFVVVSQYSLNTLQYHFDVNPERVSVLYSPERISVVDDTIQDVALQKLCESGKKYYLMLNANRFMKNPEKVISAFKRYVETSKNDEYLVTVGYRKSLYDRHIVLSYLSESDLSHVIRNSYALIFPSIFEGFGYPPLEAMRFGKPVLASNVTSMPEILGNAPIYFSPIYESDIFRALNMLNESNYKLYSEKSANRYKEIVETQHNDIAGLIQLILE